LGLHPARQQLQGRSLAASGFSAMTGTAALPLLFAAFGTVAAAQQAALPAQISISRNHAFVTTISVGTPPQELRCLLDSGSTDLWVPSKRCKSCHNERYFHADQSSTFAPKMRQTVMGTIPKPVTLSYGSGEISGFDVQDTVKFGSVALKNQTFIIVEDAALPPGRDWAGRASRRRAESQYTRGCRSRA